MEDRHDVGDVGCYIVGTCVSYWNPTTAENSLGFAPLPKSVGLLEERFGVGKRRHKAVHHSLQHIYFMA